MERIAAAGEQEARYALDPALALAPLLASFAKAKGSYAAGLPEDPAACELLQAVQSESSARRRN